MDHPFSASPLEATDADYARWIEDFAVRHRFKQTVRRLMAAGWPATPALRRGLRHDDPDVRVGCCVVLDHFLDDAAVPELIESLADADPRVRSKALHALACERCKEGACLWGTVIRSASSGASFVFVDQPAEPVAADDLADGRDRLTAGQGRA